jgi:hypothetical protein
MIKNYMQMMSKLANEGREAASRFVFRLRHYRLPGRLGLASPPNADSLAVALDVEQRASLDGGNNLPSASEEVISGSQREIVDHHRRLHDKARRKVKKLSAKLLAEARRVDPSEVTDRLRDVPSKCQNQIDRVLADFDSKLKLLHAQETSRLVATYCGVRVPDRSSTPIRPLRSGSSQ